MDERRRLEDGGCRSRQLRMIENLERYVIVILYCTKLCLGECFLYYIREEGGCTRRENRRGTRKRNQEEESEEDCEEEEEGQEEVRR